MDHPWGISGPEFLWLYGGALVVALVAAVGLRASARRPRLAEPLPAGDANMLAYLVGGPRQVVQAALARLLEQGAVRVSRKGIVTATTATVADPLDQAVLAEIGRSGRRVDDLVERASGVAPMAALAESVAALPLRVSPACERRARRIGLIAPYVLLVVGAARFVNGLAGGYPVGYLAIELTVTAILIVVLHVWGREEMGPYTVHGRRVVANGRSSAVDAAALVAVGGVAAYPDDDVAAALGTTMPATTTVSDGGGGGGGSGCGSGSSCGGGGCGGGGG